MTVGYQSVFKLSAENFDLDETPQYFVWKRY